MVCDAGTFGIFVGRWGLFWRALKLGNRRMVKAIAACVRLHNLCVDAHTHGDGEDWSVEFERLAREEEVQNAAGAATAAGNSEAAATLRELAVGGAQVDWDAHLDADGVQPKRAGLDAEQQTKATALLAAREASSAGRKRRRRWQVQHPEHREDRAHARPVVLAAVQRAQIAQALHDAGETRVAGKAAARARLLVE